MSYLNKINSLSLVRKFINNYLYTEKGKFNALQIDFQLALLKAQEENPWFTQDNIHFCLQYWANHLTEEKLTQWLSNYPISTLQKKKTVGLILAGNIPMVGFHDVLCVLLSGNTALIKLSSKDKILIPFLLQYWKEIDESIDFVFVDRLNQVENLIATGSNNTALYLEYYFKKIPHIIRKNRTSIAVLNGNETKNDLVQLATDIFTYFGLGCRNVTQLFLPENYDFNLLFEATYPYKEVINHNKYANNYDYNKSIYLLNKETIWDNNFMLLKESRELFSPISVLYYSFYNSKKEVEQFIKDNKNSIQCVASNEHFAFDTLGFGKAQLPELYEYADGIDTLKWLMKK